MAESLFNYVDMSMIETYDVGSMPFFGDFKKFSDGSSKFASYPLDIYETNPRVPPLISKEKL